MSKYSSHKWIISRTIMVDNIFFTRFSDDIQNLTVTTGRLIAHLDTDISYNKNRARMLPLPTWILLLSWGGRRGTVRFRYSPSLDTPATLWVPQEEYSPTSVIRPRWAQPAPIQISDLARYGRKHSNFSRVLHVLMYNLLIATVIVTNYLLHKIDKWHRDIRITGGQITEVQLYFVGSIQQMKK